MNFSRRSALSYHPVILCGSPSFPAGTDAELTKMPWPHQGSCTQLWQPSRNRLLKRVSASMWIIRARKASQSVDCAARSSSSASLSSVVLGTTASYAAWLHATPARVTVGRCGAQTANSILNVFAMYATACGTSHVTTNSPRTRLAPLQIAARIQTISM